MKILLSANDVSFAYSLVTIRSRYFHVNKVRKAYNLVTVYVNTNIEYMAPVEDRE